jgi:AraC-like DNA-binding protein
MSKTTKSSLFMFSPLSKYAGFYQELLAGTVNYMQLAARLIQLGEQAHSFRQFDLVREVGLMLSNIPAERYQTIGYYFLAIAENNLGNGDQNEARRLFELAVDSAPDSYKAKAILSLGALAFHRNDFDSAFYFYKETIRTERVGAAGLQAVRGITTLKSIEGFHRSAISDLETALPLISNASPNVRLDCLNSYAVELSEVGRLQEAEKVSSAVITSPLARFYPEWQETLSDVRSKQKRRSTVTISRSQVEQEYESGSPVIENALQVARVQTVIDFMDANLHRRVQLNELAKVANLSPAHLSRLFNIQTGLSPGEYLIVMRMEKARHLLTTSLLSIKQIMAMVGYNVRSRGVFIRQFKKCFDLTPSEYRKRNAVSRQQAQAESNEGASNILQFPVGEKVTDIGFTRSEINRLKNVSLTPLQLLGAILRAKLKDRITDEEVDQICSVYYHTLRDWWRTDS